MPSTSKLLGLSNLLYSLTSPLEKWAVHVEGKGLIKRVTDPDVKTLVIELSSDNVNTTYMHYPKTPDTEESTAIKHPFFVMLIKNLKKYCFFEIEILDDLNAKRMFRVNVSQSVTRVQASFCSVPLRLSNGWNLVHVNLIEFTHLAFGTMFVEVLGVQIHANCRIWGIFFADRQTKDLLPWCLMADQDGRSSRTCINDIKNKFLTERMSR